MPKPKPLAGVDTLLLLLTQHWARDESVFRTEDDRLDFAAVTLFLAFTGGRPAEFVHVAKNPASQDPLGKDEETPRRGSYQPSLHLNNDSSDYEYDSEVADDIPDDILDEDLFDGDKSLSGNEMDLSDSDDEASQKVISEKQTDGCSNPDSGYISDRDSFMTESEVDRDVTDVAEVSDPTPWSVNVTAPAGLEEERRKCKALCYEDICLWIVQNPKLGERDVLAMEVSLRHHKGADKKPKPYANSPLIIVRSNSAS
jgi:hypothetical protein